MTDEYWQAWAETMRDRFVVACAATNEPVIMDDDDLAVLVTLLETARGKGLKRSRLGWDAPGLCGGRHMPVIGMNAEKLGELFTWEPVRLGVGFNHMDRIHVFLEFGVNDAVLSTLGAGKNDLWCEFAQLFRLGRCSFAENVCLEIPHFKRGNSPKYGFIEFMEYLVKAGEAFAVNADYCCDLGGTLMIAWSIYEDFGRLTDEGGEALRIMNSVYSQCIRRAYLSGRHGEQQG